MDVVNLNSILDFFNEFTNANDTNSSTKENIIHRVGTVESENFSNMLLKTFQDFGLKEVSNLYSLIDFNNKLYDFGLNEKYINFYYFRP